MRRAALMASLLAWTAGSCSSGDDGGLSSEIACSESVACPIGMSCLVNVCVDDGVVGEGGTCSLPQQCETGLICRDFVCSQGCLDVYYKDACTGETWCKPVPGETVNLPSGLTVPAGECGPSECNPAEGGDCGPQMACVVITATVGACLPYCEYGFSGGSYFDTCSDDTANNIDYACQPMGLTYVPVCFPAGGDAAPENGVAGCDAVRNPCHPGSICHDVVCRELCTAAQVDPCDLGQICASVGQRTDVAYCLAD